MFLLSLEIMCSDPNTLTILSAKEWRMGHHSFTCPEGKHVDGKMFKMSLFTFYLNIFLKFQFLDAFLKKVTKINQRFPCIAKRTENGEKITAVLNSSRQHL